MVGGVCGGLAFLIAIIIIVIKWRSRLLRLEDSRKPNPFPATLPLARDQIASLPANPPMNEKLRMRLAALNMALSQPQRQPEPAESSDFHILSPSVGRAPAAEAGPSTTANPFLSDDFVIDCRREDGPSSGLHGSATPPPTVPAGSVPPGYPGRHGYF